MSHAIATKATSTVAHGSAKARKEQQDRLERFVEFIVEEGINFPKFTDSKLVMRVVCSRHTRTIGPMMWQACGVATCLHLLLETCVVEVRFFENEDGVFLTKFSQVCDRDGRPSERHCAYCWNSCTGGKRCGLCRTTCYCGEACMTMHWVISHKKTCIRSLA